MAEPVWVLSVDLQTKTATFQSGMADAAKSARGAFTEIKSGSSEMGSSIGGNMFASRHAIMAVSEAFGVQVPRAITALLAHIGPLGAALEAAFPFAAIALGAVLLIEKLGEMQEAGIKLTEDQVRFGTTAQEVFNSLDQRFLQAGIRSDELRNDHLGALHHELQLINMQSMEQLVEEFSKLAKQADTVFAHLQTHWYSFGEGARGAKNAMDEFQVSYAALESKGDKQGASDLLQGTLESAEKTLGKLKEISKTAEAMRALSAVPLIGPLASAASNAEDHGKAQEIAAQQTLVGLLRDQQTVQDKVSRNADQDGANAAAEKAKQAQALSAEGAREAAEHSQKMGEIGLAAEREQAQSMLDIRQASIAERLASDLHLADEETQIQLRGNTQLQDALNKGANEYNNQLAALRDKAAEIVAQHNTTVSELTAKAGASQYREDLQNLVQSEREQVEATEQGSLARLAAIEAAIKEEQARGLELTSFYRDLQSQRVETQRAADAEGAKLAAEAGKLQAEDAEKTGMLRIEAEKQSWALLASGQRVTLQQQIAQEQLAAQQEYALKMAALQQEEAALDKGAKDYANKLKAIQAQERQLVQAHENEVTAIKEKAEMDRNSKILSAETRFNDEIASGLTQVLMGHKSFASMMNSLGDQVVSGMLENALKSIAADDMTKERDAAAAARKGYLAGLQLGGPAGFVLGPIMAAAAFTSVMAFEGGGVVPGVGRGDTVPAMLTPGEGVIPGGVMDGLDKMARSGGMGGGGTHYHTTVKYSPVVHALDGDSVGRVLDKHGDVLQKHFESTLRKFNR